MAKCNLSVNVNKIALLRNSRGMEIPSVVKFAQKAEAFGADGITVHPRPDQRHIRFTDVYELKEIVTTEYNIEGYPNDHFIKMVLEVKPTQVTLVPDPPNTLTSDTGWDTKKHQSFLKELIDEFHAGGIRTSIFLNPEPGLLESTKATGTDRIELYTGDYAKNYHADREKAVAAFSEAAKVANELGIGINAGHDLNLDNLKYFDEQVPGLLEVSIGHALVRDCLYYGLENVIGMYQRLLS